MTTLTMLLLQRKDLEDRLRKNTLHINKKKAKTVIQCESSAAYGRGCGAKFFIKEITYLQTHWYETPSGCTGGDTYHLGEGQFECPMCNHRNRLYQRKHFEELKSLFKHVIDVYED